ncbi:hypothetical protein [Bradyrhizobium sp. CB3481]|uniref:hypothetical protein n=1 Tax=Bradyrhizobium sp. CB3481 TaxID=3039158 RepID=UPI0024B2363F|nr:hypothetical protein [Bradyrhizobium sp. CB3481]WFU14653.1 hypothetical protein QA643_26670 [Bradyrhizobium sp. CB3481]
MRKPLKNVGASVRARLLNLSKERNEPFELLLTQYALERLLSRTYEFKDDRLARAIRATFDRRKTQIPTEQPDALSEAFANDPTKIQQWTAFIQDVAIDPGPLNGVVETLATFLMPHAETARNLKG